ncbi:MAG: ABC transporter ATP-binding protein [Chloroflexi bacterium]|nr:ABC transporter ATP-binding protein [Chloroflexota bacterium]
MIETVNLCQRYGGQYVLKDVNLKVDRGEVFGLIGPTGAGKTTLLRLIDLIDTPSSGKIYFDGVDTAASGKLRFELRRRMAFVLQKPVVFNASVYDNVACGLRWRRVGKRATRQKVEDMLEMVGLSAYKDRNARSLSGGEAQRVAIARAMVVEPEVLLLDEPTANLDPVSAATVEELIARIIERRAVTVVMTTHDMSQGQRLADRIGVLMDGSVLQTGAPREVFSFPRSRRVAEFVGVENIIDGVIVSNEDGLVSVDAGGKTIQAVSALAAGERVCACVRPEDVILAVSPPSSSARNMFAGEITRLVSAGSIARVEMDCGFPLSVLVTKRSVDELGLEKGKRVYASFKATAVHIITKGKAD